MVVVLKLKIKNIFMILIKIFDKLCLTPERFSVSFVIEWKLSLSAFWKLDKFCRFLHYTWGKLRNFHYFQESVIEILLKQFFMTSLPTSLNRLIEILFTRQFLKMVNGHFWYLWTPRSVSDSVSVVQPMKCGV